MLDRIHPSDLGQLIVARLLSAYFEQEIALLIRQENKHDRGYVAGANKSAWLKRPFLRYTSDDGTSAAVCVRGQDMLKHTRRMDGWSGRT